MQIEPGWGAVSVFPFCGHVIRNTNTVVQRLLTDTLFDPQLLELRYQLFVEKCSQCYVRYLAMYSANFNAVL